MTNNLALKIEGNSMVAGLQVPNINGGFGEGKRSMLAKHIANIHDKELFKVNELINNNRKHFRDFIDVIDIKIHNEFLILLKDNGFLNQNAINRASNIYLLSERGYAKLIKIFDDEKSWELYDQLLDEYFELRDGQQSNKPLTQLEVLQVAISQLVENEKRLKSIEDKQSQTENKVVSIVNYLVESPDRKKIEHEVNAFARRRNMKESDVRMMIYGKIEDKYGVDVMQRVKNRHKKINEDRIKEGKREYKESTLKGKYNGMDFLVENGMLKDTMEILAGLENL